MSRIGFVGGAYQSQVYSADAQACINLMPERDESGAGKAEVLLVNTPGLATAYTLTDSPVRGEWVVKVGATERAFAVAGSTLFELNADGTKTNRGAVANDGKPVSFANSNIQVMIASGGQGYCFPLATSILSAPIATIAGVVQVAFCDTFFAALIGNSAQWFLSAAEDGTTWDPAQTAIISVFADKVVSMASWGRYLCFFGGKKSVCYYNSGNFPFPFDVVPGGFTSQGSAATFGIVGADNTLFGIWAEENGGGVAFRLNGNTFQRISTHAIEVAWQGYPTISDAEAFTYQIGGHTVIEWYFPSAANGAGRSWCYDVATGLWFERACWVNGVQHAQRNRCHIVFNGKHLVGDPQTGNIYQMSFPVSDGLGGWTFVDDFGNLTRRVRRSPYVGTAGIWNFFDSIEFLMDTGLASIVGGGSPTTLTLADSNGALWALQVSDAGILSASSTTVGTANTVVLNDSGNTTSWTLGVTTGGIITTTSATLNTSNPQFSQFVSTGGTKIYYLQVTNGGILQTVDQGNFLRSPYAMLRWSKDGGHNWSNEILLSLGKLGEYFTRVIARRLGKVWGSIGVIFELAVSDRVPVRITDADLTAAPDMFPQKRLAQQLRERA